MRRPNRKSSRARGATRRKLALVLGAVALFSALLSLLFVLSRRDRPAVIPTDRTGHSPPTGGVALPGDQDGADEPALYEDGRRHLARSWTFPLGQTDLRIEDAAMTRELGVILERANAALVINGGFFDPDGRPLGLAVSGGVTLSALSRSMGGGVLTSDGTRARLWEAETFELPASTRFAIQCRPRLVIGGRANVRSDDGRRAERTALCLRDHGKTLEVFLVGSEKDEPTGPSLFALGRYLASVGCEDALNLDGGSSTGAAWREDGGTRTWTPRARVRHAVTFTPR